LLGVPIEDRDKFREWTKQLLFGRDQEVVGVAALEFVMYMNAMIEKRRAQPQEDLLSGLVSVKEEGQQLDQQELLSMIFLLLVAGHETTVNLIGNGTLALLQHPDQMQKLMADPTLIKTAVEEMLRFNGPVETTTFRWAFEEIEFGGTKIKMGDVLLAALVGANRDPEQFDNPDNFDITRDPNKHIAFGNGIHYCLGAPLARLEGAIAINTLLRRLPKLNMQPGTVEKLEWNESILLHGMKSLPVRF
jgi:cytochrome P450 PksS